MKPQDHPYNLVMENVSSEAEYWAAKDTRDQEMLETVQGELARKARRRKTLPWNIVGGILGIGMILLFAIGLALG